MKYSNKNILKKKEMGKRNPIMFFFIVLLTKGPLR